jgi:glucose/arabinose dehydrogenase
MTRRRWTAGALLALLALAGCAEGEARPENSPPSATTSSPSQTSTPAPATSNAPTPEEVAAEAATAVVSEMLRVTDAAKKDPGARDWEPEIRRFAGDPAALLAVTAVRDYATIGLRQEGDTAVDLEVTGVDLASPEGPTVKITGCYDSQSTGVVKAETGEVVPPGTPPRYVWDITVTRYEAEPGSPWLVNRLDPLTDRPC